MRAVSLSHKAVGSTHIFEIRINSVETIDPLKGIEAAEEEPSVKLVARLHRNNDEILRIGISCRGTCR